MCFKDPEFWKWVQSWYTQNSKISYQSVPIGSTIPFAGSTAPCGWLPCYGQEVSRMSYPHLFEVIGITYGAGDGFSTFNVPNLRDRFVLGVGNNALGTRAGSPTATPMGTVEDHILTVDEMPAHTHVIEVQTQAHSHNFTPIPHTHRLSMDPHTHVGTADVVSGAAGTDGVAGAVSGLTTSVDINIAETTSTGLIQSMSADGTVEEATQRVAATAQNTGGDQGHNHVFTGTEMRIIPPFLALNYIIRAI